MSTYADADVESRTRSRERRPVPAYGPVDALLGYGLFYVVVERATPTVVAVVGDAVGDAALVRLGLALALWFVLAVTLIDQLQRQLAALGVVSGDGSRRWRLAPFETLGPYVALALAG